MVVFFFPRPFGFSSRDFRQFYDKITAGAE